MPDSDLKLTFSADVSGLTQGAEQAKSAVADVGPKVEDIGKSFSDLGAQVKEGLAGVQGVAASLQSASAAGALGLGSLSEAGAGVDGVVASLAGIQVGVVQGILAYEALTAATKKETDEQVRVITDGVDREARARRQSLEEQMKGYRQFTSLVGPVVSSFTSGLMKMAEGTQTFAQTMGRIGQSILNDFISRVINPMIDKWLWGETEKVLATQQGQAVLQALGLKDMAQAIANDARKVASTVTTEAAKNAAKAAGAATGVAIGKAANAAMTTTDAATAAKGAYASASQVPVIGWILGPVAAAAAFAGVEAFAAGGMDVGSWAPITQLHPQEMVLPARLANPMRSMMDDYATRSGSWSGPPQSSGDTHVHHYNISAMDAGSFKAFLRGNKNPLSTVLQEMGRAGMKTA